MIRWLSFMIIAGVLVLTACAPQATPTPTSVPPTATDEPEPTATDEPAEAEAAETAADQPADSAPVGEGLAATVSTSNGRLRSAPAMDGEVIAELARDSAVTVIGQTADTGYFYIVTADGLEGWIARNTVALEDRFADVPVREP
jgi:uncharacterized protein YgiM (DUF1202 family)